MKKQKHAQDLLTTSKENESLPNELQQKIEEEVLLLPSQTAVIESRETTNIKRPAQQSVITREEKANLVNSEYHHVRVGFINIARQANASIILSAEKGPAIWSEGPNRDQFKGISISSYGQKVLMIKSLLINDREICIQSSENLADIYIDLFVKTLEHIIYGIVNLPPLASIIIESSFDRTSLIDMSSFSLSLRPS